MQKLPYWILTNPRPSFHDVESATVQQMTAKVYGAMNELIEEYNSFVEESNANIEKYGAEMIKGQNEFTTKLIKTNREFFDCIKTFTKENAQQYENLEENTAAAIADYVSRLKKIDGNINPAFESGGMSIVSGALTYASNPRKIRTKEGQLYEVASGSKVWLTDYTDLTLTIYYSYDGTSFQNKTITGGEYVFDGDCLAAISINSDIAQIDTANADKLKIIDANNLFNRVEEMSVNNLFPAAPETKTTNGLTFSKNEDGTISVSGTATAYSYFNIFYNPAGTFPAGIHAGKSYYIDFYSLNQKIKIQVRIMKPNGELEYLLNNWYGGLFEIPADAIGLQIRYEIANGVSVANQLLKAGLYPVDSFSFSNDKRANSKYKPMLTIIYDDSEKEFHEYILPIIKSKNVPIATAVISEKVNENHSSKMTWEQIDDCFLNGAEILDHTYSHIEPATRETMSVEELQREYLRGRNMLKKKGYNPPCALIFNGYTAHLENCRKAAMRIYKAGFNASTGGINFKDKFDPYDINRFGTDGKTLDQLKAWIDELSTAGSGWMVWTRHNSNATTENPTAAAQIISDAIDYARQNGIEIVTVERGLYEYLGI